MNDYIEPKKLIEVVKRRSALYNKHDAMYNNKRQKMKLWMEACKELYPNWDQLRPQHRLEKSSAIPSVWTGPHKKQECFHDKKGRSAQKRWRNFRTAFRRELKMQKSDRVKQEENADDESIKLRKRYRYFNAMTFLLDPSIAGNFEGTTRETDEDSLDHIDNVNNEEIYADSVHVSNHSHVPFAHRSIPIEINYEREENVEDKALEILREMKKNEEDEDRQFMLSLVPSFRKLKDKQKFEAKIEILRVLKDISFQVNE